MTNLKLVLLLTVLVFVGIDLSAIDIISQIIKDYSKWKLISPEGYSIPRQLAILCVSPVPPPSKEEIKEHGPHALTFVRVFANPIAAKALSSNTPFPEGSILVKEKNPGYESNDSIEQGIAIKRHKGYDVKANDWEFRYSPSAPNASFASCTGCHKTAAYDFIFVPYIKQNSSLTSHCSGQQPLLTQACRLLTH